MEQNQVCHIYSLLYEMYQIALSVAQSLSMPRFEEIIGACGENMERDEFARSCSRLDVSNKIWRHLIEIEVKFILESLVSESFS